jgi:hypothetical protein
MVKKTRHNEYSRSWRGFVRLRETRLFLLLYINESDAHIIQKRMFGDKCELETFKKFAEQNIWGNQ